VLANEISFCTIDDAVRLKVTFLLFLQPCSDSKFILPKRYIVRVLHTLWNRENNFPLAGISLIVYYKSIPSQCLPHYNTFIYLYLQCLSAMNFITVISMAWL
jgi:hypothetical protein